MRNSPFEPRKAPVMVLALALALAFPFLLCSSDLPIERELRDSAYRSEARAGLSFEERVAAQHAIEEVYWNHRIWPQSNAGPKPSLDEVMSESFLREKVGDYLRQSNALELLWDRPITTDQLQAEIDRMARDSRRPEMLAELYAALGNDPVLIAECLARPNLASRLIHRWYARDQRFHGELRSRAEQSLAGSRTIEGLSTSGGHAREVRWTRPTGRCAEASESASEPASEAAFQSAVDAASEGAVQAASEAASVPACEAEGWARLQRTLQGWSTASTDRARPHLTFAGRPVVQLGPIEETDDEYSLTAVTGAGEDLVTAAVVSWAKTPFDTWWRQESPSMSSNLALPAVAYAVAMPHATSCAADSWTTTVPTARYGHTAVWTGSEMIIWGGGYNSGGRYNPSTDTWTPTSVGANVPSPRKGHTAIWTGEEMVIWGGQSGSTYLNTGGRYAASADVWTPTDAGTGVPSARAGHTAVWTGTEMIIWGGLGASGYLRTGGRYKPTSGSHWVATTTGGNVPSARSSHTAIWTGSEMIVWGGTNGSLFFDSGERYNPSTNTWTDVGQAGGIPSARSSHTAVWTGKVMIVWGGYNGGYLNTGSAYNPETNLWRSTAVGAGCPAGRSSHTVVWTGTRLIVWGGWSGTGRFNDGGVYDAGANVWSAVGSSAAPLSARDQHTAVWTGTEMIVWGGVGVVVDTIGAAENTGARYSPLSNTWVPTRPNDPTTRDLDTAVWTGSEMIVWGGRSNLVTKIPFNTGGLYDPSTSNWRKTSVEAETPSARYRHSAVWTGTKMIVWGGYVDIYNPTDTGGLYDPMTDHWSPTSTIGAPSARWDPGAVWTGSSMIVWGGGNNSGFQVPGGRYDPSADSWTPTTVDGAPQGRYRHTMVWTGARVIVWGGLGNDGPNIVNLDSGARYDPSTDSWSPTATGAGHPSARARHTAVWTGNEMIVWGGRFEDPQTHVTTSYNTGGRYDPSTDTWGPTNGINVPSPMSSHTAIWTGNEMIVWGANPGGRYNPAADFWQPTNAVGAPLPRAGHTAVATGSEMIAWGGDVSGWPSGDGGSYCYACTASTWYRDSDGDGFGDPSASAVSCVQPPGYVANSGDCNDASAASHPGGIEICDGLDNDCDGTTDNATPPTSPPVLQVEHPDPDTARLSWGAVATAEAYDVVRGSLDLLRSTGGDFTVATGACLGNDLAGTTYEDSAVPGGGQGFWYLVRAVSCGGPASYDEGSASQAGSRDAEIQASAAACP